MTLTKSEYLKGTYGCKYDIQTDTWSLHSPEHLMEALNEIRNRLTTLEKQVPRVCADCGDHKARVPAGPAGRVVFVCLRCNQPEYA